MTSSQVVTRLLLDWSAGSKEALDELTPLVYGELRRLAGSYLGRERPGHTLQPTALIHEAYVRMAGQGMPNWENRAHFFGIAAQLMRQILVDHARARQTAKRKGIRVQLDAALTVSREPDRDIVALDDALKDLAAFDPRKCRVIELRFFGGLTAEETARVLGVSPVTVTRELRTAEAWLHRHMNSGHMTQGA